MVASLDTVMEIVTMKVAAKHLPITAVMKDRKTMTSNPMMKYNCFQLPLKNLCQKRNRNIGTMLCQDAITRDEYKQLNTMLAESLDEEMDLGPPPEEEDGLKKDSCYYPHCNLTIIDGTFSRA